MEVDFFFFDTASKISPGIIEGGWGRSIPFIFQPVAKLENFDFNLTFSIVFEDFLVWLALTVF